MQIKEALVGKTIADIKSADDGAILKFFDAEGNVLFSTDGAVMDADDNELDYDEVEEIETESEDEDNEGDDD